MLGALPPAMGNFAGTETWRNGRLSFSEPDQSMLRQLKLHGIISCDGLRAHNVGQVTPNVTFQLSAAYRFNLNQF